MGATSLENVTVFAVSAAAETTGSASSAPTVRALIPKWSFVPTITGSLLTVDRKICQSARPKTACTHPIRQQNRSSFTLQIRGQNESGKGRRGHQGHKRTQK